MYCTTCIRRAMKEFGTLNQETLSERGFKLGRALQGGTVRMGGYSFAVCVQCLIALQDALGIPDPFEELQRTPPAAAAAVGAAAPVQDLAAALEVKVGEPAAPSPQLRNVSWGPEAEKKSVDDRVAPRDLMVRLDRATCRCRREIAWARTIAGEALTLDPEPVEDGDVLLTTVAAIEEVMAIGEDLDPETVIALVSTPEGLDALKPDPDQPRYRQHEPVCPMRSSDEDDES